MMNETHRTDAARLDQRRSGDMPGQPAAGAVLPAAAEQRVQAVCDWLTSLERRQVRCVTLAKVSRDLWPILGSGPAE